MRNSKSMILIGFCLVSAAHADVKTWTNASGGAWSVAANWSPNGAPLGTDVAVITLAGSYTVNLDGSPTIAGLVVGGGSGTQTLAMNGQTLVLNGSGQVGPAGKLQLSGKLSGTNHIFVEGEVAWGDGILDTFCALDVGAKGSLLIGGGAEFAKVLSGTLTNAGIITYTRYGALVVDGTLCNLAEGSFVSQSPNRAIVRSQPTGRIINLGLFQVASGLNCEVPLINSGTVDTQAGALVLGDGCVFNDGTRFTGAGVTRLDSGTNCLTGNIYSENLLLQGASMTGIASLRGLVSWGAGYIDYGAQWTVATNGQLVIGGGANYARILLGSLTNAGTIVYAPPGPFGVAGLLHNLPGALFDIQWNSTISKSSPAGVMINQGTFRRSVGTASAVCEVPLFNSGTIEAMVGTVVFGDGCVFNDGTQFTGTGITQLESGTNILNGSIYSENLLLQGATMVGAATLTGTVTWGAGELGASAAFMLATNSQLFIGGGANFSRVLSGSLTNAGTIVYAPPGAFVVSGSLHNLPHGLIDIQWNSTIFRSGSTGVFVNRGTLRKSLGVATSTCEVRVVNDGIIEAQTGAIVFGDDCAFNDGSRFIGAGVVRLESGTNLLSGNIYSENLLLQGATIAGAASVSGGFAWGAGYIDAQLLVASNSQFRVGGGANYARVLRGSLTNSGTIVYEPPGPFGLAGRFHNLPGGLFETHWDCPLYNSGPEGLFINEGTCRKSAGAATVECQVPFINRGTVDVPSGRLRFLSSYVQPSGDLLLRSGTVASDQPLTLAGGRLLGWGTVEAELVNAGATVFPDSSNGVLTISGNYAQLLGGTLELLLGGTDPGTNLSHLKVTGAAKLSGTLAVRLQNAFLPAPDDVYQVMSFGSHSGDFARRNGLFLLGRNLRFVTSYSPQRLALVAVAAPDPTGVSLQIGFLENAALVSWPLEFGGGTLYACTNLARPQWVEVPAVENRFLDDPMTKGKWFRLSIP